VVVLVLLLKIGVPVPDGPTVNDGGGVPKIPSTALVLVLAVTVLTLVRVLGMVLVLVVKRDVVLTVDRPGVLVVEVVDVDG